MGKFFHGVIQRFCECLDERTASGRACLVELNTVYGLIFNFDAFHILTADVEDTVYIRFKVGCGVIVRHCFYLTLVKKKSRFDQCFPITG